jgi:putative transposase
VKCQQSPAIVPRHAELLERIRVLKAEHPFWGYPRIWASLRFVERQPVNTKRIMLLLRAYHPRVQLHCRLKTKWDDGSRASDGQ